MPGPLVTALLLVTNGLLDGRLSHVQSAAARPGKPEGSARKDGAAGAHAAIATCQS